MPRSDPIREGSTEFSITCLPLDCRQFTFVNRRASLENEIEDPLKTSGKHSSWLWLRRSRGVASARLRGRAILFLCLWLCTQLGHLLDEFGHRGGMRYCHLSVFLSTEEKKHRPDGSLGGSSCFPESLGLPRRRCAALERGFSLSLPLRSPHNSLHSFTVQHVLRGFAGCSVCSRGSQQKRKNRKKTESSAPSRFLCVEKMRWETERKEYNERGIHNNFSDKLRNFVCLLIGVRREGHFCFCLSRFIFGDTVCAVGFFLSCGQLAFV